MGLNFRGENPILIEERPRQWLVYSRRKKGQLEKPLANDLEIVRHEKNEEHKCAEGGLAAGPEGQIRKMGDLEER